MTREALLAALAPNPTGNILWGKKWAVLGDSFTQGVTGTLLPAGPYAGRQLNYAHIIASRNNMELLPYFRGGRCLAFPADGSFHNSVTDPEGDCYYQSVPQDCDYITICLGINDSHHEHGKGGDGEDPTGVIPLGSPEDQSSASYCGAWNLVLDWFQEHRPYSHLGILITNGCDRPAYREAQLETARRHGVPWIDLNGDQFTPAMIRSQNPDLSPAVKERLRRIQAVDYPRNTHPNDDAHLFEASFIEAFLRRL